MNDLNATEWESSSNGESDYAYDYAGFRDYSGDSTYGVSIPDVIDFKMSESSNGKINRLSAKFYDYFSYAVVLGEGVRNDTGSCPLDCGSGKWNNMCCAEVSMWEGDEKSYIYACMDQIVADQDLGIWLDSNYFQIQCRSDNDWEGDYQAGAKAITAGVASMVLAVAATFV
jgi:hypothetical protein